MSTQTLTQYYCQFCDIVAGIISNIAKKLREKSQTRSGVRQLYAMTDRELKDIGISRGDIGRVENGSWQRMEKF